MLIAQWLRSFPTISRGREHIGLLGIIALMSFFIASAFREKPNRQFMRGARDQAVLTDNRTRIDLLRRRLTSAKPTLCRSQYIASGFSTKQASKTYNVIANGVEQVMMLPILIVDLVTSFYPKTIVVCPLLLGEPKCL